VCVVGCLVVSEGGWGGIHIILYHTKYA